MRRRKTNTHLPPCVYQRHGAYYLVKRGKWTRLGSDLAPALQEYARLMEPRSGMAELLDEVLERAEVKASTRSQYEQAAGKLKRVFAEFAPEDVEPRHIAQFMDHYRSTPNMANRCRSLLKMAFDRAVQLGVRQANPVLSIPRHKERKRDRYLTDDEYHRLLAAASAPLQAMVEITYLTGQRIEDVLSIRLSDLTDQGILFRQGKTGARLLVESPDLVAAVERAKALHGRTPKMYLLAQRNGKKRSYRGAYDLLQRAAQRAGINDIGWHDLRAKAATDAKAQGLNAQQLMGHTTEQQTVRYIRNKETVVVSGPSVGQPRSGVGQEYGK